MKEAGYDPARLPPGQYLTSKWPVLHAGSVARYDGLADWTLRVFGDVENELELTWKEFLQLPHSSNVQDIHCVTRWSKFDTSFEGVHWRELARLAAPHPTARFVIAHAEAGFTSNIPLSFLEDEERTACNTRRRRAADARPRLPAAARDSRQVLLEERQVAARHRALLGRQAGVLGAVRILERRRPLARRALRLLSRESPGRGIAVDRLPSIPGLLPSLVPRRAALPRLFFFVWVVERRRAVARPPFVEPALRAGEVPTSSRPCPACRRPFRRLPSRVPRRRSPRWSGCSSRSTRRSAAPSG